MTKTTKRILFFQKFATFTQMAHMIGIDFVVTDFYRTAEQQKAKYDAGTSQCDGANKRSAHQDWLAIDVVIIRNGAACWDRDEDYEKLGAMWKEMFAGIWGGDWASLNDIYHIQAGEW